jgi:hypothetical protein
MGSCFCCVLQTLSVSLKIQRPMVEWLLSNELERVWKETVWTQGVTIPLFSWREWGNQRRLAVRIAGTLTEIQTDHFSNTSPERYRYDSQLSKAVPYRVWLENAGFGGGASECRCRRVSCRGTKGRQEDVARTAFPVLSAPATYQQFPKSVTGIHLSDGIYQQHGCGMIFCSHFNSSMLDFLDPWI